MGMEHEKEVRNELKLYSELLMGEESSGSQEDKNCLAEIFESAQKAGELTQQQPNATKKNSLKTEDSFLVSAGSRST